jgi:general secretion pathway protein A
MQITNGESPAEFFNYTHHPFADTYRLKMPYLAEQDQRFCKTALSLIHTGKSFALTGPSGAGKSTLINYLLTSLDVDFFGILPKKSHGIVPISNETIRGYADSLA